jgi:hypothetical protein
VTADDRTYGGASHDGKDPDLLAVMVDGDGDGDGVRDDAVAFADEADLGDREPHNPDEALRWQAELAGYLIPLYATDGTCVVATFTVGEPASDAMAVVAAQAPPGAVQQEVSGPITVEGDCPFLDGPSPRRRQLGGSTSRCASTESDRRLRGLPAAAPEGASFHVWARE